ncbi:MAG: hypothetical protein K1Y36_22145 [Blastocatellia bacterium]|nr:hypothetical protein [Blastocatellia bacterium]
MRRLVAAFIGGDLSPPSGKQTDGRIRRQVADTQSGDKSPHSKFGEQSPKPEFSSEG